MANKHKVPLLVLVGKIEHQVDAIYKIGVIAVYAIFNRPIRLKQGIDEEAAIIEECTKNIKRAIYCFRTV